MSLTRIAERALNTPLLIEPRKAGALARLLLPRIVAGAWRLEGPQAFTDDEDEPRWSPPPGASILGGELDEAIEHRELRGFAVRDGVAVIGISGTLVHRGAWIGRSSGQTSYEGLAAQIDAAVRDAEVRGIALEIDSYGGEVAGCFDLADRIRAARSVKPVYAFLAENACSAGYALASQADRVTIPRTGVAGSIGVIQMHVDMSRALDEDGLTVTLLHAGRHKVDGNPYQPLASDVADSVSAELEALRRLFAETVAAGRGARLEASMALATEARCFMGEAAVDAGLADSVAEPRAAFEEFVADVNGRNTPAAGSGGVTAARAATAKETVMSGPQTTRRKASRTTASRRAEEPAEDEEQAVMPEDDQAEGDPEETAAEAEEQMVEDEAEPDDDEEEIAPAASTERRRIAAILDAPEAQGRESLARHLAFKTGMSVKDARAAMAAAGRTGGSLSRAMAGRSPAPIRPAADRAQTTEAATAERILANAGRLKQRS